MPRHWGGSRAAIADGTHVKLRENNLLGAWHIRYGGYGGIAYHHIADTYIALFTSFIPCGVWEAAHILDGLLKNRSAVQPDTLHADTQGQSESVFGLCRLMGIKLMPRMRGLGDVTFYRPAKETRYRHIDALFTGDIDWDLIATHARDMIQVVLSIQAGRSCRRCCSASSAPIAAAACFTAPSGNSAASSAPCSCCASFPAPRSAGHSRRDHQDRSLQRLP